MASVRALTRAKRRASASPAVAIGLRLSISSPPEALSKWWRGPEVQRIRRVNVPVCSLSRDPALRGGAAARCAASCRAFHHPWLAGLLMLRAPREADMRDVGGEQHLPGPFDENAELPPQGR